MILKFKVTWLYILFICSLCAADVPNPVFWERSFSMNISDVNSVGTLNQATSFMVTSQDFQGIHVDSNARSPPDRIVFNFGDSCPSSNTTFNDIQQLNFNSINAAPIANAQKIALVKRGNCNWSQKVTVVNNLAMANSINITAVFIYDNDTHSQNESLSRTAVQGSGSIGPPSFSSPLPAVRSILNMSDNDLAIMNPSSTTVYFVPFDYGNTFVQRINASYDSTNPTIRQFWLLTPYLEEVSWGFSNGGSFSAGRGYLSYIIALAAIFLIGVIFLRWWRIRKMRSDYANGRSTGFTTANGFNMQQRVNQADPLPVDIVNSLPIDKYSVDLIKNLNCAICLEDFVPGKNDIRILPCGHGFCVLCIDPWLTQKSTMCPICKWDCLPVDLRRERNEQMQQQHQQQQPAEMTVDMSGLGTSSTENQSEHANVTETATLNTPITTTNGIIPPTLLPASSPPSSPAPVNAHEKEASNIRDPFADQAHLSAISETPSGESSISQTTEMAANHKE